MYDKNNPFYWISIDDNNGLKNCLLDLNIPIMTEHVHTMFKKDISYYEYLFYNCVTNSADNCTLFLISEFDFNVDLKDDLYNKFNENNIKYIDSFLRIGKILKLNRKIKEKQYGKSFT